MDDAFFYTSTLRRLSRLTIHKSCETDRKRCPPFRRCTATPKTQPIGRPTLNHFGFTACAFAMKYSSGTNTGAVNMEIKLPAISAMASP